jgi:hypothetical protein
MSSIPPFSTSSNYLYNNYSTEEESENGINLSLSPSETEEAEFHTESPPAVDPVNDLEITPNSEYTKLCNLVLDKKFKEAINLYTKGLSHFFSKKMFKKEFSNCTTKRELPYENIKKILNESFIFLINSHIDDERNLEKFFIPLIEILKKTSMKHTITTEIESSALRVALVSLFIIKAAYSHGHYIPFTLAAVPLIMLPMFKEPKNLLGVVTGVIAYTMDYHSATALGVSLFTSEIARRLPIITSLFKKVMIRINPVIDTAIRKAGKTHDKIATITDSSMNFAEAYILAGDGLVNRVINPISNTLESTIKAFNTRVLTPFMNGLQSL